jgi:hypothetical protein
MNVSMRDDEKSVLVIDGVQDALALQEYITSRQSRN